MNILMLTNTYLPHVGGVARSVEAFAMAFRRRGHRVVIVAPEFEGMPSDEVDVIRVPAIQKFNGSDFSVRVPIPGLLTTVLEDLAPDVIHSHHPFLLGDAALRIAAELNVPLVFTHHTMYEQYTHYVPGDSATMKRFVVELAVGYANLCDSVIAPSDSVAAVLRQRGVIVPIEAIPTGVDVAHFGHGNGQSFRSALGIPDEAFVVGHVGRLAPEKNLPFLAAAVAAFMRRDKKAHFLIAGTGPSTAEIQRICRDRRLSDRLHLVGTCQGQQLVDAYHAMDVFAFASQSETQGMVLSEAMAAGVPVVAVDAPGVRELVVDTENGRLLPSQNVRSFTAALRWLQQQSPPRRESLRRAAQVTAQRVSIDATADHAIRLYQALADVHAHDKQAAGSAWEAALRLVEAEWELWSNVAHALGTSLEAKRFWQGPWTSRLHEAWQRLRRWLSRSEWCARLLHLPRSQGTRTEPGLVLVQIDGLSRHQLEQGLRRRRLPFLRQLLVREHYRLHTLYSGLPSSTPAVQAELFYGVEQAVPAFSFLRQSTGQVVRMIDPASANDVQTGLSSQGMPLLSGGSAYSDIYSGGAAEPHFCSAAMGWGELLRYANPTAVLVFLVSNFGSLLRTVALLMLESALAIVDSMRGMIAGHDFWAELKFVPSRVLVSVLLRDLITISAEMDVARGLPVVHINYLGYDEQSHRRGPSSLFAHWTLKGIDHCIRRLWIAARHSTARDYSVWVYSDHGQEQTVPYTVAVGKSIQEAVATAFRHATNQHAPKNPTDDRGEQSQRVRYLGGRLSAKLLPRPLRDPPQVDPDQIIVAAMGPLGHVYLPTPLSVEQVEAAAKRLAQEEHVPLVLMAQPDGTASVWTGDQRLHLPADAVAVLGEDHPFLQQAAGDLARLCHHSDAGDLVLCGWRKEATPLSFALEHGAHAGPGREETRAFALLPADAPLPKRAQNWFRPGDLRQAALVALERVPRAAPGRERHAAHSLRIVTYNVHSCLGLDGQLSPARIARVIAQCDPDVVALQELDVRRPRTRGMDQAHAIAAELGMEFQFHPAIAVEEEQYGDAVLSRLPLRLVRAGPLPTDPRRKNLEPRGALWVAFHFQGQEFQLINTHLGLSAVERLAQVEALLGPDWAGHTECRAPLVLCGDFNALPRSKPHRRLCQKLRDAQLALDGHRPRRTFFSRFPLGRIDHVFLSDGLSVVAIDVPRSQLAGIASDHLPLVVELRLSEVTAGGEPLHQGAAVRDEA